MVLERLNSQQFNQFRDFIYAQCGIRIDENKVTLLSNRIRRRLRAGDFDDFDDYYQFLTSRGGASELESFLDAITTNETFFFRTEKHFEWLKTDLLSELVAQHDAGKRPPSLRIWSAGCASGAEPYSIAIAIAESRHRLRDWSVQIIGTDISEAVLEEARQGGFRDRAVEAVSQDRRRRFFSHSEIAGGLWQVRPTVKQSVEFEKHNLMHPMREASFDCIFIRNVLIYFDRKSKQVVIDHLIRALSVGGYLVVGPSEGVYDMLAGLQKISPLIYRKVSDSQTRRQEVTSGDAGR